MEGEGTSGHRVAVTGVGSALGRRVADELARDPVVKGLVGLDRAGAAPGPPQAERRTVDLLDADLADHLDGLDVIVHTAFAREQASDRVQMRAHNVDGTRNLLEAARRAGVRKVVYVSSAVVYGAHPDNDLPLTESSPLRANDDFPYAEDRLEVERWLAGWSADHDDLEVVVLRAATVVGPGIDHPTVRQLVEAPRYVTVKGYRPPWQALHVDDLAGAVRHVIDHDLRGTFNVAAEGWMGFDDVLDLLGQRALELPEGVAFSVADRMWRTGVTDGPPGALHYLMFPWVLAVERLTGTGWQPHHTNRDILREMRARHADHVTLPAGVRVRGRDLKVAAGIAGGLVALVAVRKALERRGGGAG